MIKSVIATLLVFGFIHFCLKAETYLPANFELPERHKHITPIKIDLALDFAFRLLDNSVYINIRQRDSVVNSLYESGRSTQVLHVAKELGAQKLLFTRVNVIENIIRTDLSIIDTSDTTSKSEGFGYALVSHFDAATGDKVYDPALLTSILRALAIALNDSLLFADKAKGFEIYPASTLVIGGIFYAQDGTQSDWDLFKNHVVSSFTAVESIFESIYKHKQYVVYDMTSRDSVYALFRLYGVENYTAPSQYELSILEQVGVDYFVTGSIERIEQGAKVRLGLYAIRRGSLAFIKERDGILDADNMEKYQNLIRQLASELLE